jgi:hypothetical protein
MALCSQLPRSKPVSDWKLGNEKEAQTLYHKNKASMNGGNDGGFVNSEQKEILQKIEDKVSEYAKDPDSFPGWVGMLDAPGGTGND